ncbi:MAG: hypothetical protein ACMUIP_09250 [bacterium]
MKRKAIIVSTIILLIFTSVLPASVNSAISTPVTLYYQDITFPSTFTNYTMVGIWDLNAGPVTVEYTLDLSGAPNVAYDWNWDNGGIVGLFSGGSGARMCGFLSDWENRFEQFPTYPDNDAGQDLDDKFNLQRFPNPGSWDETMYDVDLTLGSPVLGTVGSNSNYGIWFDRDGVDQWQDDMWGMVDGGTYNTGGIYDVKLEFNKYDPTTGYVAARMFPNLANSWDGTGFGIGTGFYITWKSTGPDYYPTGISFSTDETKMGSMQVSVSGSSDGGTIAVKDLTVTGYPACCDEVWVDDDWASASPGSEVVPGKFFGFNAFDKIQDGIDAVCGGGTVNVAAGDYQETIDLGSGQSEGFDLIGEDKDTVFWRPVLDTDKCLMRDNRSNNQNFDMELTGFTFIGGLNAAAIVHIYKNGYSGGTGDCFLDIHDNNFVSLPGTTNSNYGLWMCKTRVDRNPDGSGKINIHDNVFKCVSGICMSGCTNFDIYNNDFSYDIVGNGIFARKNCALYLGDPCGNNPSVRGGHHIHDNVFAHVGDGYMETIDDVSYYDTIEEYLATPRAAVIIEAGYRTDTASYLPCLIEDNNFNSPNGAGIHYEGFAAELMYTSLNVGDENFTEQTVRNNGFFSHIKAIFSQAAIPAEEILVNAPCNWWGAIDGPSGEGLGSGDAITGNVDVPSWLLTPDGPCVDLFDNCGDAKNHGQFVSCVAQTTKDWVQDGLITKEERTALILWAAQSDLP